MKTNEGTVFVFIASIIIGVLITMNLSLGKSNKILLSAEDFSSAYQERNKLYKDLSNVKNDYYKVYNKFREYNTNEKGKESILDSMNKELEGYEVTLGLVPLEGEGIKITLKDASNIFNGYYSPLDLIHDSDIEGLINDLRNAGAEAVSVNGQRVIFNTYSMCAGPTIDLGGMKIVAPFYINAIGNKSVLKNYLVSNRTHYKELMGRRVETDLQQIDNIRIPAYTGKIKAKHIKIK